MITAVLRKITIVVVAYCAGIALILCTYTGIAISNNLEYSLDFVYTICPVLQIKDCNNVFLPESYAPGEYDVPAGNYGPVIVLGESVWNDKKFHMHELAHVEQRYRWFFVGFHVLYNYSREHNIYFEYEAYKAENSGASDEEIAMQLSIEIYRYNLSKAEIMAIITNRMARVRGYET
jgi:hypothetical protein